MPTNTRSQVKSEIASQLDSIITESTAHSILDSDDDLIKQVSDPVHSSQGNLETSQENEQQRLKSIKKLTEDEMVNIDQWLLGLHNTYDELKCPALFRVHYATTYFQKEEKEWYEQEKIEINDNWSCFCKKLKQYIHNRLKIGIDYPLKDQSSTSLNGMTQLEQLVHLKFIKYSGQGDAENWLLQTVSQFKQCQLSRSDQIQAIPLLLEDLAYLWFIKNEQLIISFESFSKLFLQQFSSITPSLSDDTSSLKSKLSITMATEIIKTPTYFRGSKDDVLEWLEKLEQRFKMANWDDEHKLRYISIHLQEDAYRWWIQASGKITSWLNFVNDIKQAFGSTKMKELAFGQLRGYKQSINQSITQYYDKIVELCNRIDLTMTDSMKLQYLMAGVKESLKLHIALHDPQTTESFLSYARKVEDTLSITNTNYELNQCDEYHAVTRRQQFLSKPSQHHKQQKTYTHNQPRITSSKQSSVICYTCGTPGHYSRDCTRSHFE